MGWARRRLLGVIAEDNPSVLHECLPTVFGGVDILLAQNRVVPTSRFEHAFELSAGIDQRHARASAPTQRLDHNRIALSRPLQPRRYVTHQRVLRLPDA